MDKKTRVSYSQYSMWKTCPMWWDNNYRLKLAIRDDSIHTLFGTAMHEVIQWWLKELVFGGASLVFARSVDLTDEWRSIFIRICAPHVKSRIFAREEIEEFYEHGVLILRYVQDNVKKLFPTENVELHSIEYELKVDVAPGVYYTGFIDIVTRDTTDDTYRLYDLKTSTKGWNKWIKKDKKKTDQMLLYKKFFSIEQGIPEENIDIEYVILKRTLWEGSQFHNPRVSKYTPSHGGISMRRVWKEFLEFVTLAHDPETGERIGDNSHPTPSESNCKWCPYADGHCPNAWKPSDKKKDKKAPVATESLF